MSLFFLTVRGRTIKLLLMTTTSAPITLARISNLFLACRKSPARFSRLSDRLARIAGQNGRLWALSRAANEQRHMLICLRDGDTKGASGHSQRVGAEIRKASM